jgi:hypothetical protein
MLDSESTPSVEVLLDNFTEVEHTATAHLYFGYDPNSIADITNDTQSTRSRREPKGGRRRCRG